MLTTFTSYGAVAPHRQAELIRGLSKRTVKTTPETVEERLGRLEAAFGAGVIGSKLASPLKKSRRRGHN